jgi:hypothetical protein
MVQLNVPVEFVDHRTIPNQVNYIITKYVRYETVLPVCYKDIFMHKLCNIIECVKLS